MEKISKTGDRDEDELKVSRSFSYIREILTRKTGLNYARDGDLSTDGISFGIENH